MDATNLYNQVQSHYGSLATGGQSSKYGHSVAVAFGYSEEELSNVPEDAQMGLCCGNAITMAALKEGETVVDFGCGAGFDVFLAAKRVGPTGRVIGVDRNKDMLARAHRNKETAKATNVEFVESPIVKIDTGSSEADCIISNCVVNLVPEEEKQLVFNEMHRILKPGGRVAVSDILAKKELPEQLKKDMALYVGCISGASQVQDYEKYLKTAGFSAPDILLVDSKSDLNVYTTTGEDGTAGSEQPNIPCCGPAKAETSFVESVVKNVDFNEWAGSFKIYAVKGQQ
ncbi:arsenite S-adenosylmethyltransferase [Eremomyces bilateralis CBS 781.70]|uniref:Arsenite methyltransferase n=1 Tax=Eremomyces bilateralis CBS 781.70 TaxID=1392243 RepID=A0A6G1G9Y9_9PEZI|nr:arsenite S-adenosylmethyltransferase [Eremomyces bilateralis CBS 781.70]KAF1814897.1 arsenite S-adenosylmethyltransferase [Eremomyces bilateralis CBS 781.70]